MCPEPPNPWVVAGSILGGVVFLGLVILTLIKIIIYIISRREVKEWEKERNKTAITCVSIFYVLGRDPRTFRSWSDRFSSVDSCFLGGGGV